MHLLYGHLDGWVTHERVLTSDWQDGFSVVSEYGSLIIDDVIVIENRRTAMERFGPFRFALTRQGMDAAARRLRPGARYTGQQYRYQSSNPLQDTWRRIYSVEA